MKKSLTVFLCLVLLWAAAAFALAGAAAIPAEDEGASAPRPYESGGGAAYGSGGAIELASRGMENRLAAAKVSPPEPAPFNI